MLNAAPLAALACCGDAQRTLHASMNVYIATSGFAGSHAPPRVISAIYEHAACKAHVLNSRAEPGNSQHCRFIELVRRP